MKPLPKSLHTITALARVAKMIRLDYRVDAESAVTMALCNLGYNGATDPHGLTVKAVEALKKLEAE